MRARYWLLLAGGLTLLPSGCLRLEDEPLPDGARGAHCVSDADCGEGSHCLLESTYRAEDGNTCAPLSECNSKLDCPLIAWDCVDRQCVPKVCESQYVDVLCGHYHCDKSTNTCFSSCKTDADCDNATCQNSECVGNCKTDGCRSGSVCRDPVCKQTCSVTGPTTQCGNYRCVPPTKADTDGWPVCADSCTKATDCLNGSVCTAGKCGPKP